MPHRGKAIQMRPLRERFCAKVWSEETHQVVNGYSLSKKEIVELNTKSKKDHHSYRCNLCSYSIKSLLFG